MDKVLIVAIGMVLILEGLGPLLVPNKWAAYLRKIADEGASNLRIVGAVLVLFGTLILFYFY